MGNQKTVIKVGTSTLTYDNGKVNYRRIESLCKVLADKEAGARRHRTVRADVYV